MNTSNKASVIIPFYGNSHDVFFQIDALMNQETIYEFEILICDNGPTYPRDSVEFQERNEFLKTLKVYGPRDVRIIYAGDISGPSYARNVGVKSAKHGYLFFCDADDVVSSLWIETGMKALLRGADYASGPLRHFGNTASARNLDGDKPPLLYGTIPIASSCNLAIRKEALQNIGYWNTNVPIGEDVFLSIAMHKQNKNLTFCQEMYIDYRSRETTSSLLKQGFGYGRSDVLIASYASRMGYKPVSPISLRNLSWPVRNIPMALSTDSHEAWVWKTAKVMGATLESFRSKLLFYNS